MTWPEWLEYNELKPPYALSRGVNKVSVLLLYWSVIYAWRLIAVNGTGIEIHARKQI